MVDSKIPLVEKHTLQRSKEYIYSLDLSEIIARLVNIEGWSPKHAKTATKQYKNFLFLKKKYGLQYDLPPSKDIDEVWHAHVLHTRSYRNLCKQVFNDREDHYLDHKPHKITAISSKYLKDQFEYTQELYHQEFGEYIYHVGKGAFLGYLLRKLLKFIKLKRYELLG